MLLLSFTFGHLSPTTLNDSLQLQEMRQCFLYFLLIKSSKRQGLQDDEEGGGKGGAGHNIILLAVSEPEGGAARHLSLRSLGSWVVRAGSGLHQGSEGGLGSS